MVAASWKRGDYPLPDFLANAPQLRPHLQIYYDAFWDLMSDRGGMGDGYIKWTAARSWADMHGFGAEEFATLWYHLREMDSVFIKAQKK